MQLQVVYKRYASLYFVMGIDQGDNELITLEVIHHYVEVLDRYFGNVCELDLIFNFHKVVLQSPRPLCCSAWHLSKHDNSCCRCCLVGSQAGLSLPALTLSHAPACLS